MAVVASSADKSSNLLKKLSLDLHPKVSKIQEPTKKYNAGELGNEPTPAVRSTTPLLPDIMDANVCYVPNGYASVAYYYGGYGDQINQWGDYPRYDVVEGSYGGCRTMMCHPLYGYLPYGTYLQTLSPVQNLGPDGKLYGPHNYQCAASYSHPPSQFAAPYSSNNQTPVSQGDISTSVEPHQGIVLAGTPNGVPKLVDNGRPKSRRLPVLKSSNQTPLATKSRVRCVLTSSHDPQFNLDGTRTSTLPKDQPVLPRRQHVLVETVPSASSGFQTRSQNDNLNEQPPHLMVCPPSGMAPGSAFMNTLYTTKMNYNHNNGTPGVPSAHETNSLDSRANGFRWMPIDGKYKPRERARDYFCYINEGVNVLNEQNKGPRSARFRNRKGFPSLVTFAVKGQNITTNKGTSYDSFKNSDRDQYNLSDFPTQYSDAMFFVIKSYSEDDVHKSIKYNVWASTPNGNKKLDSSYQEATGKTNGCPVFLLFSVNASGQFCGLAEMVGPVDFNRTLDYWHRDKWTGCFPVKWHIVKDIPNNLLKHITLKNNDNKPVTNSRDTQEVKFEQGLELLKIFKDHVAKTCLLDDFGFYETRQKQMQENRIRLHQLKPIQKPIWEGKSNDEENEGAKPKPFKPTEPVRILKKSGEGLGEYKPSKDNSLVEGSGVTKPAMEKRLPNGVANGC